MAPLIIQHSSYAAVNYPALEWLAYHPHISEKRYEHQDIACRFFSVCWLAE